MFVFYLVDTMTSLKSIHWVAKVISMYENSTVFRLAHIYLFIGMKSEFDVSTAKSLIELTANSNATTYKSIIIWLFALELKNWISV